MYSKKTNKYLIIALITGLLFHGSTMFFTLESTYDALIHLFFAEHYSNSWFDPWSYKWYTGFTVFSYPPLVHQAIALLSTIAGLKFGLYTVALISIVLFITGVYRFALVITSNKTIAGYTAILGVLSSSFAETLHVFGQLPSIVGISVLLHALPEIYSWLKTGQYRYLISSLSLIAVTVTSHHVTPIFGMVFFIFPLIGMVIMDISFENAGNIKAVNFKAFFYSFTSIFKRILSFGILSLIIIIGCILPYWINSKNNPITQVPIPHGSRDNFLEILSSGLAFFLIPWGILLIMLPYIFYRYYSKRYLFFGLSITLLFILGTGGTTPIPRLLLGDTAFNILTLDRFTLWASIMALPIFGEFCYRFLESDLKNLVITKYGTIFHQLSMTLFFGLILFTSIFTVGLNQFRPSQPQQIKMLSILNFLNQDQHDQWRYMTLGFGDQMAWLSAQTNALSVDGNYHSARRLPELTTRPIERLENSKFKGIAGIGSLQQFLTVPEKYNLKYIFSNDKFYDPILYFCGWQRLRQLENGIMVWEKLNVPPLSSILPKEDVSTWQKMLWGVVPILTLIIAFVVNIQLLLRRALKMKLTSTEYMKLKIRPSKFPKSLFKISLFWALILVIFSIYGIHNLYIKNDAHRTPDQVILSYYDALDFKAYKKAHRLINPKSNLSIAQYMLEISVTDGLLSSYAKLDALETEVLSQTDRLATVKVVSSWITPLEKINTVDYKSLKKIDNKWYIEPDEIDLDLPPDQLYSSNSTNYFNQGRRRITTEQTHHEDILKQPTLEVTSAKLVKYGNHYAIVGEVQNIDNVPADVVLKGTLYNEANKELATYNAKYHMKHKLMPKESTVFKINFEGIAWSKTKDSIPKSFNPDEFTPVDFKEQPTKFNIQAAGNVSGSDLYKHMVLSETQINNQFISGRLFNSGQQEITVPQLLISYYDKDKTLLWVDHLFVKEGIRQQRQQNFEYSILKKEIIEVINTDMEHIYINGLPNKDIAHKVLPYRTNDHINSGLQKINHPNFDYVKIETNAYIGHTN